MIETKELDFLKKKIEDKKYRTKPVNKILARIFQQIKDSNNSDKNLSDYPDWDNTAWDNDWGQAWSINV